MEKTAALIQKLEAALPVPALATTALRETLGQRLKRHVPRKCNVTKIFYLGDDGGITCTLDFGLDGVTEACIVSITHLSFERQHPLAREIGAYCKRRIKQIRKRDRRMPFR